MELSNLVKGQEVLALGRYNVGSPYDIGEIGEVNYPKPDRMGHLAIRLGGISEACLKREQLLAVGDKVTRGPDWENRNALDSGHANGVGVVVGFKHPHSIKGFDVTVDFPKAKGVFCRMTPDHQDLKPVGNSVKEEYACCEGCIAVTCKEQELYTVGGHCIHKELKSDSEEVKTEEGKPECFGYPNCTGIDCDDCPRSNKNDIGQHTSCQCSSDKCKYTSPCFDENKSVFGLSPGDCLSNIGKTVHTILHMLQQAADIRCMKPFTYKGDTTMSSTQETFDRLERANHIKLVEKPKAENKIFAATEELGLLNDEMEILLACPTLHSEKIRVLADCASTDKDVAAKATIRALELGLPVTINVKA